MISKISKKKRSKISEKSFFFGTPWGNLTVMGWKILFVQKVLKSLGPANDYQIAVGQFDPALVYDRVNRIRLKRVGRPIHYRTLSQRAMFPFETGYTTINILPWSIWHRFIWHLAYPMPILPPWQKIHWFYPGLFDRCVKKDHVLYRGCASLTFLIIFFCIFKK